MCILKYTNTFLQQIYCDLFMMGHRSSRVQNSHDRYSEWMKERQERRAKMILEAEKKTLFGNESRVQNSHDRYLEWMKERQERRAKMILEAEKNPLFGNESFKIIRAMSLALSILTLCYYGCTEYKVLQNGQILRGFHWRRTVMTFNFGYSVSHSIISAVATSGMLIYSIIMKRPQFSLPFICFFLAELVCDFCDVVVAIWYLFGYLRIQTALLYAAELFLLILAEIWMWLGVVRLYEHRKFKAD